MYAPIKSTRSLFSLQETNKVRSLLVCPFWDQDAKEYKIVRSTGVQVEGKRERRHEAEEAAKTILAELKKAPAIPIETVSSFPQNAPSQSNNPSEQVSTPSKK